MIEVRQPERHESWIDGIDLEKLLSDSKLAAGPLY